MSHERRYVEWHKSATQPFLIGFGESDELLEAGTTLASVTSVELHELTAKKPETWSDITSEVTIQNAAIADDPAVDEEVGVDRAVYFELAADPDATPLPGGDYSFLVVATRVDNGALQVAARVPLHIIP